MAIKEPYLDIPFEVKAEDIKKDGTFKGWGSLFNRSPDAHRDLVSRGAFTETLAKGGRNRTGVAMLWQHRSDKIPGVWKSLMENKKGLAAEGKLALATQLGNDVYEIMKLGAELGTFKLGLSIGYDALEFEVDKKKKIRDLKKVDLWELSIVTFPAKLGATVTTVKQIKGAKTERELERILREVEGLSECSAKLLVKMCKPSLREAGRDDALLHDDVLSGILDGLKETNQDLEAFQKNNQIASSIKGILT